MKSVMCLALVALLCTAGASAERKLLQAPQSAPVANAPVTAPIAPAPTDVPTTTPTTTAAAAPMTALPTTTPAAPATAIPFVPVPAPTAAPTVPAPAPAIVLAPVPAPVLAPAPAPVVMPLPVCGVQPQCKLFLEDMQCCQQQGALTDKTYATVVALCTQYVDVSAECFGISGVTNVQTYDQGNDFQYAKTKRFVVNWANQTGFSGKINLDIQNARSNSALPQCNLNFSPCRLNVTQPNGTVVEQVISTVAPVSPISFTVVPPTDYEDAFVGCPANGLDALDSLVWQNATASGAAQCYEQTVGDLPKTFFSGGWVTYQGGFQETCDTSSSLASLGLNLTAYQPSAALRPLLTQQLPLAAGTGAVSAAGK